MENTFPVTPGGHVTLTAEGCYTVARYQGEIQDKVCRLWLCRDGGSCVSIGIPTPRSGQLELKRRYTRAELEKLGGTLTGTWCLLPTGETPQTEKPKPEPEPAPPTPPEPKIEPDTEPYIPAVSAAESDGWYDEPAPQALFDDGDLQEAFRSVKGAMRRDNGGTAELAVPFSPGQPFPAVPVFCFGECRTVQGKSCVVFTVENGRPIL